MAIYAAGALLALLAPVLGVLIVGYSVFEGTGSALMIPPIYILVTVAYPDMKSRARYFGVVSGAGGLGAAAGLLFGAGVGVMLTSSANLVQSSFSEADQGDVSGLSRSVSNIGSSLGTALVGSVLVAAAAGYPFGAAAMLLVLALFGLGLAVLIPRQHAAGAGIEQ